jgi:hypothetical protein
MLARQRHDDTPLRQWPQAGQPPGGMQFGREIKAVTQSRSKQHGREFLAMTRTP